MINYNNVLISKILYGGADAGSWRYETAESAAPAHSMAKVC